MKRFKRFAIHHPITFGFIVILLYTLLSTLTWPITQVQPAPEGYEIGTALAKIVMAGCFLLILWRFGWLKVSGFSSLGGMQIWLIAGCLMIYNALLGAFAFTGNLWGGLPAMSLLLSVLFYAFATSLLEETMYRGLLMTAMVKAWGNTRKGLFVVAILSGFFFASLHFINLIIRPFPVVALQVLGMTMVGFVYASIVFSGRSIWPVIIFHSVVNAATGLQVIQNPNFEETTNAWFIFNLVVLPLFVLSLFLLRKVPLRPEPEKEEKYYENQFEPLNI